MCLRVRNLSHEEEAELQERRAAHSLRVAAVQRVSAGFALPAMEPHGGSLSGIGSVVQKLPAVDMSLGSLATACASRTAASFGVQHSSGGATRRNFMRTLGRRMHARSRLEFSVSARPARRLEAMNFGRGGSAHRKRSACVPMPRCAGSSIGRCLCCSSGEFRRRWRRGQSHGRFLQALPGFGDACLVGWRGVRSVRGGCVC